MSAIKFLETKVKFLFIRLVAPATINLLYSCVPRQKGTLLIIKSDGIGDYILFRNYLYFLKNTEKYKNHKIYLLANLVSKDLAVYLDSEIIEGFYWHSDGYFLKWNLIKLLFDLQRLRPETIIYPNYSRKFAIDWLINKVRAKNKLGVDGDDINEPFQLKYKTNQYYSQLISVSTEPLHEFERNKQIFEGITGEKCHFKNPFIEKDKLTIAPNNSIVIFPGASASNKKWASANFNRLCQRIIEEYKTHIILAGAKDDIEQGMQISNGIPKEKLSCQPELNMIGLCELIGGADLLISGDTVAIHIAVSLGIPAVCISKGDLYGRFVPYPLYISDRIYCVFPRNFAIDSKNYNKYSPFIIGDIFPEDVFETTAMALTSLQATRN